MKNLYAIFLFSVLFIATSSWAQQAFPLTVIDASGPNVCDGSASITNPNNVLVNTIVWYSNGAILAQGVTSVSNLCPGTYGVYYTTFIDSVSATFIISGNPCNGLMAIVTGTPASSPTSWDGTASVTAAGGSSPYAFSWSNGATTSTINSLGVGVYTCCVTDMNGCVSCDSFTVSATINPGNDTVFVINNNNIPNVIDSLGTQQVIDCSLDYNAIGAAYISGSQYIPSGNPNTMDSIYLTWQLYDTLIPANLMATYTVGYSIFPPLVQAYVASIQIHCPQKNTNYNTLLAFDQFYSAQLGLIENDFTPGIFVNDGLATLQMGTSQNGNIRVYSSNGNVVFENGIQNETEVKFNVSNWNSGIYFVHYSFETGRNGVVKFVKP